MWRVEGGRRGWLRKEKEKKREGERDSEETEQKTQRRGCTKTAMEEERRRI